MTLSIKLYSSLEDTNNFVHIKSYQNLSLLGSADTLVVLIVLEVEDGERLPLVGPVPSVYVGDEEAPAVLGAVDLDVPVEVERRGHHHDAEVVDKLAKFPLPVSQVGEATSLALVDDVHRVVLHLLGQVLQVVADCEAEGRVGGWLALHLIKRDLVNYRSEPTV